MIERSRELAGSMPEVLLCDGPTGALDSQTGISVLEALLTVHAPAGAKTLVIALIIAIADIAHRVVRYAKGSARGLLHHHTGHHPSIAAANRLDAAPIGRRRAAPVVKTTV
jgi:ABC-type lipoprotein export system ATPase subunit